MNSHTEWYKTFFNGLATEFWIKAVPADYTNGEIRFIKDLISTPSASILDIACGYGRHTIPLAQEGFHVTGVDISEDYIQRLRETIEAMNLSANVIHADVVEYHFAELYDLAICMGNSFSYFDYPTLLRYASNVSKALKKEGIFLINIGSMAESILPAIRQREWMELDDILFLSETSYNANEGYLQSNYSIIKGNNRENKTALHHVFTHMEIKRLLHEAGFEKIETYGGIDKSKFKLGDRQAYIVARK